MEFRNSKILGKLGDDNFYSYPGDSIRRWLLIAAGNCKLNSQWLSCALQTELRKLRTVILQSHWSKFSSCVPRRSDSDGLGSLGLKKCSHVWPISKLPALYGSYKYGLLMAYTLQKYRENGEYNNISTSSENVNILRFWCYICKVVMQIVVPHALRNKCYKKYIVKRIEKKNHNLCLKL